jgi:hypothetical protein
MKEFHDGIEQGKSPRFYRELRESIFPRVFYGKREMLIVFIEKLRRLLAQKSDQCWVIARHRMIALDVDHSG